MGAFDPPLPSPGPAPGPPNLAQRLVANAGFAVYEGGTGLFDEPVLVYVGVGRMAPMEFSIHDHVGQQRGASARPEATSLFRTPPVQLRDLAGQVVMEVHRRWMIFAPNIYRVEGCASGLFELVWKESGLFQNHYELRVTTNDTPVCVIRGHGFVGDPKGHFTAFDQENRQVAVFIPSVESVRKRRTTCYVASIDPNVGGDLRRLLVAAPLVIAGIGNRY